LESWSGREKGKQRARGGFFVGDKYSLHEFRATGDGKSQFLSGRLDSTDEKTLRVSGQERVALTVETLGRIVCDKKDS